MNRYMQAEISGGPSRPAVSGMAVASTQPGGFWRRFAAVIIDGFCLGLMLLPINMLILFMTGMLNTNPGLTGEGVAMGAIMAGVILPWLIRLVAMFFYYGWFYNQKGATPGKMVLGLKVVDSTTGIHLNYWQTFFRETIGKFLSGIILLIGFIMAGIRQDKKALHDILFNTQVLHKRS